MDNLWILFAAAGVMVAVIGGLALLGDHYTLNNIKSKTVGAEGIEATIEVNLTGSETKFLNELQGLEGVRHATLVSYNGEYMS